MPYFIDLVFEAVEDGWLMFEDGFMNPGGYSSCHSLQGPCFLTSPGLSDGTHCKCLLSAVLARML